MCHSRELGNDTLPALRLFSLSFFIRPTADFLLMQERITSQVLSPQYFP